MKSQLSKWQESAAIVFLMLLAVALGAWVASSQPAASQSVSACIEMEVIVDGTPELLQSAGCEDATPVATDTPEASPTPDPTATDAPPTPTLAPTATPTETAGEPIEPYIGAPECAEYGNRSFHKVWDEEDGCWRHHGHGVTSPHEVDDVFGTDYYDWARDEISYPWQTFSFEGDGLDYPQPGPDSVMENDAKHTGYLWFVGKDLGCFSRFTAGCITDYRVQTHGMATAAGTTTSIHSFWAEMRPCPEGNLDQCGYVATGGWQGPADLSVDSEEPPNYSPTLDRFPYGNDRPQQRNFLAYYDTGNQCCSTWYSGNLAGFVGAAVQFEDMWQTIPTYATETVGTEVVTTTLTTADAIVDAAEFRCDVDDDGLPVAGCKNNGSQVQLHNLFFAIPERLADVFDPDGDRVANFEGYSDRYGNPITDGSCTEVGLDCVPLIVRDVQMGPVGQGILYQFRGGYDELDVCFTAGGDPAADCRGQNQTPGWITFPTVGERHEELTHDGENDN